MSHQERATGTRKRPPFAMVPRELIESGLDDTCVRIYALMDGRQGDKGWSASGAQFLADKVGMQERTFMTHARHLECYGLIAITRRGDRGKYIFDLVHNPSRPDRFNLLAQLPELPLRAKKISVYSSTSAKESDLEVLRPSRVAPRADRALDQRTSPATTAGRVRSMRYEDRCSAQDEIDWNDRSTIDSNRCITCGGFLHFVIAPAESRFCDCPF